MPQCSVDNCDQEAILRVILYDFCNDISVRVFFENDITCPFLCGQHAAETEKGAKGERKPRGVVDYPSTNKNSAQGFTIYQPLEI